MISSRNVVVSIIIVNYNGSRFIPYCLKALERQSYSNFEIIFVDNASSDNSLKEIQRLKESLTIPIKTIPLDNNTGFSGGNISGLRHASGKYIALLNNDTEPDIKWLEELVKGMDSNPDVGICGSKLIVYGTDIIDSAGDGLSTSFKGFKRGEGEASSLYNKSELCFGACAGAALYRRKMIDKIGFLDEDFFLIHEDTDLNLRAQIFGWKVLFVPAAIVHHKVRSTIGSMSETAVYYTIRNSEYVKIKNIPFYLLVKHLPEMLLAFFAEVIYFAVRHRHPIIFVKAKIDVAKMFPVMLRKRKGILDSKRITNEELQNLLTPVFERNFLKNKIRKFILG